MLAMLAAANAAVSGDEPPPPNFARHVVPMLYKLGCSAGTCHGAFAGRGSFRLSLFAARPDIDFANIRAHGRRLDLLQPDRSLLLVKPTQEGIGHAGGTRFAIGSRPHRLLRDWIVSGAHFDPGETIRLTAVRVEPSTATMSRGSDSPSKVSAVATLSDGREEDVTWYTTFESRDPSIAEIDGDGNVHVQHAGDIAVLAHYAGKVAFTIIEVPTGKNAAIVFPDETPVDVIDRLLLEKLRRLNIVPSESCSDAEFIRRAFLDVTSTLPTPDDVRKFLADDAADKRSNLVDRLLEHPLHNALSSTRLTDMLGADNRFLNSDPFHDWFRNKLEQNMPWDKIAYGVLCGSAADDRTDEEIRADLDAAAERRKQLAADKKAGKKAEPDPDPPPLWRTGYATRRTMDAIYSGNKYQRQIRDDANNVVKTILDSKKVALQLSHAFLGTLSRPRIVRTGRFPIGREPAITSPRAGRIGWRLRQASLRPEAPASPHSESRRLSTQLVDECDQCSGRTELLAALAETDDGRASR